MTLVVFATPVRRLKLYPRASAAPPMMSAGYGTYMPPSRTGRAAFFTGSTTLRSSPVGTRGLASGLVSVVPGTAITIAVGHDAAAETATDAPVALAANAVTVATIAETMGEK